MKSQASKIKSPTTTKRFARRVTRKKSGCWEFGGYALPNGYCTLYIGGSKKEYVHRVSWMLFRGAIPAGKFVLHKCDNRRCVNPKHLFIGTQKDNIIDMWSKGRQATKEQMGKNPPVGLINGNCKLTEYQVLKIRSRAASGESIGKIARDFCVGYTQIKRIISRQRWKHLP